MSSILELLESNNIPYRCEEHEPVFTVAESMAHLPDKFPVKNLLLKEEKGSRSVLVVMKGDERLDVKDLAQKIGYSKLQFAKPEFLLEKLNVLPGAVSLFSIFVDPAKDVLLVLDERLKVCPELGFHPDGDNSKTLFISGNDIERLLELNSTPHQWLQL